MGFTVVLIGVVCLATVIHGSGLSIAYQWKYVDWTPGSVERTGRQFIFGKGFTLDMDFDAAGRLFVTSPLWSEGIPITLATVTNLQGPGGPLLEPYPDWSWHTIDDCNKIISVYRIAIDECNRLWLVDNGRIGTKVVCPMKIMLFDLHTDRLIHKYIIPDDQSLSGKASLVTPIVELGRTCHDAIVYIADVIKHAMLIYDLRRDYSWRINNTRGNAFGFENDATTITIAGESYNLTDGTLGMSLSPPGFFEQRYLYFNSLASFHQKFADVRALKYSQFVEPRVFQSKIKRVSQAGVQATSRRGVIFFQLVHLTALACWNIERPFTSENIVTIAMDPVALQYISGIKIKVNRHGQEELWLNTNRLQKILNYGLDSTDVNLRIIHGLVDDLIVGTKCAPSGIRHPYPDTSSWQLV